MKDLLFSVVQKITEDEAKKTVTSVYTVTVYVDGSQNILIVKNPTTDTP